ncbi:hypothetical protein, partial [Cyclobacterium xiamenense]|uniref:hypothetical protein n=1 Tax=Cyclobacterium xiamenense TaxID=1297121 RepID=UPI0019D55DDA
SAENFLLVCLFIRLNLIVFFNLTSGLNFGEYYTVILKGNLQNEAIYNVKYQIDIASCNSFEVPEEDVLKTVI